ncbi:MAG: hypothetical protein JJ971_08020 [Balneolaceae bacterium]|nr:hypothetical protein [Balneolaceae bacterium]MBO6546817.1 hypothetical protein [Balneolaceae bacterium]MBO6649177.1 hypothetical protein [Balneolaceae bacterium]
MRESKKQLFFFFVLMVLLTSSAYAQFEEPDIKKVEIEDAEAFEERFAQIKWTGEGFNYNSLDRIPAIEIRARLEGVFGKPTKTIEDIVEDGELRAGKAIQFEYWFIIDGEIPMMVLDLDGPFADGLVYVGASRYIDLMPQVKRTLTRLVTEVEPKEYTDYFYSPERYQWYKVTYADGLYKKEEIDLPSHIRLN